MSEIPTETRKSTKLKKSYVRAKQNRTNWNQRLFIEAHSTAWESPWNISYCHRRANIRRINIFIKFETNTTFRGWKLIACRNHSTNVFPEKFLSSVEPTWNLSLQILVDMYTFTCMYKKEQKKTTANITNERLINKINMNSIYIVDILNVRTVCVWCWWFPFCDLFRKRSREKVSV